MNPLITLPVRDQVNGYLRASLDQCGYPWLPVYGSSDLPRIRSVLLSQVLKRGHDRVLCIDADIVADAADIQRLAEHPYLDSRGAVTGLYALRSGKAWACKLLEDPAAPSVSVMRRAEFAGLGFAAITLDSLQRVRETLPTLEDPEVGDWWPFCVSFVGERNGKPEYCADDVSLWRRLEATGTQLWADTSLVVGHQALVTLRSPVEEGTG